MGASSRDRRLAPAGGVSVVGGLAVGLYAWIAALLLGATLLDVLYASQVAADLEEPRDLLLVITGVALLVGAGAVAASWRSAAVRSLLLVSLALVMAGLVAPALLARPVEDLEAAVGFRVGPWIRLAMSGAASLLALVASWEAWRRS